MNRLTRRVIFYATIFLILSLISVYPPLRLVNLIAPNWPIPASLVISLLFVPLAIRMSLERVHTPWSRACSATVLTWLGICFLTFCTLLPAELLLMLIELDRAWVGCSILVIVCTLSIYGIWNATQLSIRTVDLNAPQPVRGISLVQISDVHIGSRQPGFLKPIVDKVNALNSDYILITGDLIDMRGISEQDLAPLANLNAPTLYCIGNHERYIDLADVCARLRRLGIKVLRNQSVDHDPIQFLGIDDAESKHQVADKLSALEPLADRYRVLLYHRPDGAEHAARWGVDFMLTGHTHRGQIVPFNLLVKRVFPRLYRDYQVEGMTLYVSPGTGTWGPVIRLGSKCEITLFRLL